MTATKPKAYSLRLPTDLKQWVQATAKRNDRSVNAELNRIVRKARENEQTRP